MNHMEQLTPRAVQIMDLAIQGLKSGEIAKRLDLTHPYICTVMAAPNFQHQLSVRRGRLEDKIDEKIINTTVEAGNEIKKHAVAAARKMVDLLDNDSPAIQHRAAGDILDRAGVCKKSDQGIKMQQQIVIIDDKTAKVIEETLMMEATS